MECGRSTPKITYKKTPTGWEKIPGSLKDISVGKNSVWGTNLYDDIFKRVRGGDWQHVHGKLKKACCFNAEC